MMKNTLVLVSLPYLSLGFVINSPIALLPSQSLVPHLPNVQHSAHRHCFHVASLRTTDNLLQLNSRHDPAKPKVRGASPLVSSPSSEIAMSAEEGVRWAGKRFPGCSTAISQATRLSGVLNEVWEKIADPSVVQADKPHVLVLPDCPAIAEARGLQGLYEHLEVCQDACDRFGREVSIVPHPKGDKTGAPFPALVVQAVTGGAAESGDDFGYDPGWDGDWDIDRSLLGEDYDDEDASNDGNDVDGKEAGTEAVGAVVRGSDEEVTELTKTWVQAVITDMGVCPFSVDASRAGLPVGQVRYPVTRETTAEGIYREYWKEVELLVSERDERSLSTTLLIAPEFALNNAEAFEIIGQTLTQPLEALSLENDIQLVFFHPQYSFRDGQDRIGSGGAANYARRSPFPMINILRTNQVRLAQKSIPTGLVYKQNEEVLEEVGAGQLQKMLERRDWTGLEGKKVDRKRVAYYETARKLQGMETSSASVETTETPAVDETETIEPVEELSDQSSRPTESGAVVSTANDVASARESLATAAGSMATSYDQGFSSSGTEEASEKGQVEEAGGMETVKDVSPASGVAAATAATVVAPPSTGGGDGGFSGRGGMLGEPAASSVGIADEDLRLVATTLVKRLGSGMPLKTEAEFVAFSEAVDHILRDTTAAS